MTYNNPNNKSKSIDRNDGTRREISKDLVNYFNENVLSLKEIDYDEFCDKAKQYAKELSQGGLSTSQIRKVYSLIYRETDIANIKKLRPQFAYTSGKSNNNLGVRSLMELLDSLVKQMKPDNQEHLANIKTFMEALVAYLRYFKPSDK